MTGQALFKKYPETRTTLNATDGELKRDFENACALIDPDLNSGDSVSLSVVRDWIALERRQRILVLGRDLAH